MSDVNDSPFRVAVESGAVLLDGPYGAITSLTPGAALETADRLIVAASQAQGQRVMADIRRAERAKFNPTT